MTQALLLVAGRLQPQPAGIYSQEKLVFALAACGELQPTGKSGDEPSELMGEGWAGAA